MKIEEWKPDWTEDVVEVSEKTLSIKGSEIKDLIKETVKVYQ